MRRAETPPRATGDPKKLRDSASQIARAVLGLRDMLLRGAFRPGERIAEIPLSAKLGVSRTPLRLAFERLAHEGLIHALPHSGFTATAFSMADIWDAIEARGILEGAAARLAAERLKYSAQLDSLRKINREMEENPVSDIEHFTQYLNLNEVFHLAVVALSNNQSLRRAIEQIYRVPFAAPSGRVILNQSLPGSNDIRPIAEEHHRAIVDAIEHREGARAESVAREHTRLTRRHLEEALADRSILETIPGGPLIEVRNGELKS